MLLTSNDIKGIFSGLITGEMSREEADRWAFERMQEFDAGTLEFHPVCDEEVLWGAIQFLYGVDTKISPDEYMNSLEDIRTAFEEKWEKD